jgi:creatinine amidohydrolase/Fe(II)-dependent formamide hydrolase-like protein
MAEQEGERRKPTKNMLADTMTSRQMAEHRRRDGILLLPVGCFEMHDMHVGLSCDTFSVEAVCRILAEEWDAVVLPPIHYTYPGATSRWPGSVAVRPREAMDYIAAVVKAILRNGFRKVVVVNVHGPSQEIIEAALRQVFEETGEAPIHFDMDYGAYMRRIEEEFGNPHGEAAFYLAALYICGRHGEFDPAVSEEEAHPRDVPAFESLGRLWRRGAAGPYVFVTPWSHVGQYAGLTLDDAPRAAEILRECLMEQARGLPGEYEQFQRDMRRALADAPWDRV